MNDKKIENKIDGKLDKTTDRLTAIAEKAGAKAKELAHAVTGEVRDVAHKTGDAVKHAGEKIKKFVG
jgi:glycerate-2-kinase